MKRQYITLLAVATLGLLCLATPVWAATVTWDPGGGGTTDGSGTWLDPGKWWNGTANVDWNNATPDNAVIGNGGAGGNISLGTVTAGTLLLDNFTGTYTLSGTSLDTSGGITIGANAGNVNLPVPISGTGGITVNGAVRVNLRDGDKTFSGDLIVNAGEVLEYTGLEVGTGSDLGTGNYTLNGGVHVDYWQGNFIRNLGSGAGEVQLIGGESGFTGQGRTGFNVKLNNGSAEVVWGASGEGTATGFFNPSTLVLQSPWANYNGHINFTNAVDLNGATRTVEVAKEHDFHWDGPGFDNRGRARMTGTIQNSDAVNTAGLIKEGPGRLVFEATNTYDGGLTVNEGIVQFDRADAMPSTGAHAFKDGTELWTRVGGTGFTGAASGAGSLGGLLSGTGPGTSTVTYTGDVDLTLFPNSSPDFAGDIPNLGGGGTTTNAWIQDSSMTLSGASTYSGATIIGRRGGSAITVTLGSDTAIPSGGPVIIDSSGESKLDLNGNNATIGLLKLGSNSGGSHGQVTDSAGGGVLTLTDGVLVDGHNDGAGGLYCIVDLNGATQTFTINNNRDNTNMEVISVIQNGGLNLVGGGPKSKFIFNGSDFLHEGGTTLQTGKLIYDNVNNGLVDTSTLTLAAGTVLDLNFVGTDTIAFLILDGTDVGNGTYDATHPTYGSYFTGTGSLLVSYFNPDIDGINGVDDVDLQLILSGLGSIYTEDNLNAVLAAYGKPPAGSAEVPEPGTMVLLLLGALGLMGLRRRK